MVTEFIEVMQRNEFQKLAAFMRIATATEWQQSHPESKFAWHYNRFVRFVKSSHPDLKDDIIGEFAGMVSSAIESDIRLASYYTTDVFQWFIDVLSAKNTSTVLMMCLAVASCADNMLTPVECAERIGKAESTFRNRANNGDIAGALKKGKQWLIPESYVKFIAGVDDAND